MVVVDACGSFNCPTKVEVGGGVGWGSNVHVDVHTLLTSHDCYVSCCAWLEAMPTKVHRPARCVLGTKISVRVHDPKKNMKKMIHACRTPKSTFLTGA